MNPILHPIFALLASVTRQEPARQVAYLKEENKILRARLPQRLVATPQEKRRLLKFGRKLGVQLRELISIVSYQTFVRWIREKEASHAEKKAASARKPDRPRTPDDIRELVLKLARENDWGYTRILGELRKLGIRSISRQTVKMILKEHDIDPGPQRGKGSWEARLRRRPIREESGRAAVAKTEFMLKRSGNAIFCRSRCGRRGDWSMCICSCFCIWVLAESGFHRARCSRIPRGSACRLVIF